MPLFLFAALLTLTCATLLGIFGRLHFFAEEFPHRLRRVIAGVLFYGILTIAVFYPAVAAPGAAINPAELWFPALFAGHALLVSFLIVWWILRHDEPLRRFLLLDSLLVRDVERGLWVGAGGWVLTVVGSAVLLAPFAETSVVSTPSEVPSLMIWLVELPLWRKLVVIVVAMTVEEAFFRAFLQQRIGWIPSSLLFAISHASYGLPTLTVGVFIISLVIGWSLKRTGRLLPCIIAHGVFDSIQLLVILPWAVKMLRG